MIISLYARGMTVRDIETRIREVYGYNISDATISNVSISNVTAKVQALVTEWWGKLAYYLMNNCLKDTKRSLSSSWKVSSVVLVHRSLNDFVFLEEGQLKKCLPNFGIAYI